VTALLVIAAAINRTMQARIMLTAASRIRTSNPTATEDGLALSSMLF
jgi:hypothetical protein